MDDIFNAAANIVRTQAEHVCNATDAPKVVYLLWAKGTILDDVLVGVCGTLARAEQEAADLKRSIRIEARQVHW